MHVNHLAVILKWMSRHNEIVAFGLASKAIEWLNEFHPGFVKQNIIFGYIKPEQLLENMKRRAEVTTSQNTGPQRFMDVLRKQHDLCGQAANGLIYMVDMDDAALSKGDPLVLRLKAINNGHKLWGEKNPGFDLVDEW
jgi:hypothetical protein